MFNTIGFIQNAITGGVPILYGTTGEILTEKSGNMNLGVEGLMYIGGACGLAGAYLYESAAGESASGVIAVLFAVVCSFLAGCIGSLIFSFLTITLKANQNVTGLALTIFGTGLGQFIGAVMRERAGELVCLSSRLKPYFINSPMPDFLQNIPVIGPLLFGYSVFAYIGLVIAVVMHIFFKRTRMGLHLRSVGESPATADAAGINVEKYKYIATVVGGGISAMGGMTFTMTISSTSWSHDGLAGLGWISVALVIFCLWRPLNALWGSAVFGALKIMYLWIPLSFLPAQIYRVVQYIFTAVVLVFVSVRQKRENQPPASLGLSYFREDR